MIDEKTIAQVRTGDLTTLVSLDEQGFLIGSTEDAETYANRLDGFLKKFKELEAEGKKTGQLVIEDETFDEKERIPQEIYDEAAIVNEELYSFKIDWVPGYFVTPQFGLLFGGCAYLFSPEFFSIFIIRNSFKTSPKWYIYNRQELMSHELCHVARFAMGADKYEEHFAYQTSPSRFRKTSGSAMRSEIETYLLLGLCFGLLIVQAVQAFIFDITYWNTPLWQVPAIYIWLSFVFFLTYIVGRQVLLNRSFRVAQENLSKLTDKPRSIAFRCNDSEMDKIAKTKDLNLEKLKDIIESPIRYQVMTDRFCNKK